MKIELSAHIKGIKIKAIEEISSDQEYDQLASFFKGIVDAESALVIDEEEIGSNSINGMRIKKMK